MTWEEASDRARAVVNQIMRTSPTSRDFNRGLAEASLTKAIYELHSRVRLQFSHLQVSATEVSATGSESARDAQQPATIRWVVPQLLLISTRMVFGLATSFFDSVTVKTPLLYSALTLSTSTLSGSVKARTKEP